MSNKKKRFAVLTWDGNQKGKTIKTDKIYASFETLAQAETYAELMKKDGKKYVITKL